MAVMAVANTAVFDVDKLDNKSSNFFLNFSFCTAFDFDKLISSKF